MASAGAASRAATGPTAPRHLLAYAVRALAAAGAGLVLAVGVGLVIWAVTPASGSPWTVIRGAIAGWGAANFLPPSIGGIAITLPPLLLTVVTAGLIASAANRGRRDDVGPVSELLGGLVVGLVHGAVVTAVVAALAPPGAYDADRAWAPVLLGVMSALLGVLVRGAAWRDVAVALPRWVRAGLRAGLGGVLLMLAGGGATVAVGLIGGLGTAIDLGSMTAPTFGGGFGMLLLGLVFLPNALIAGTAYTVGVGFQIGGGTYSPWGTVGTDLPAVPLLAAVPDSGGASWTGLVTAVVPLLAAALIGRRMIRAVGTRRERMAGAVVAAAVTGIALALLALIAGGGIQGSDWATIVVPAFGVLAVTTGGLAVIAAAVAGVAGWGSVGWSGSPHPAREQAEPRRDQVAGPKPEAPESETDDDVAENDVADDGVEGGIEDHGTADDSAEDHGTANDNPEDHNIASHSTAVDRAVDDSITVHPIAEDSAVVDEGRADVSTAAHRAGDGGAGDGGAGDGGAGDDTAERISTEVDSAEVDSVSAGADSVSAEDDSVTVEDDTEADVASVTDAVVDPSPADPPVGDEERRH